MTTHTFTTTCAYFTAARYLRTVERVADKVYAPTGMKPAYSYIMLALEDVDGLSITALATRLGYDRTSLSRMVRQLAARHLVQLRTSGRKTLVELGPDSADFLVTANACLRDFAATTDRLLGPDKAAMTALLTSNNTKLGGFFND